MGVDFPVGVVFGEISGGGGAIHFLFYGSDPGLDFGSQIFENSLRKYNGIQNRTHIFSKK